MGYLYSIDVPGVFSQESRLILFFDENDLLTVISGDYAPSDATAEQEEAATLHLIVQANAQSPVVWHASGGAVLGRCASPEQFHSILILHPLIRVTKLAKNTDTKLAHV
ncbi:MAG: hypothetical protein CM15mP120_23400 [Pseudomonadota bacterium]|nr:MAG: hypothetical protein CM15mP120_23400 [Pseudomonadota bacterium]